MCGLFIRVFYFLFIFLNTAHACRTGTWCGCFVGWCVEKPPKAGSHGGAAAAPDPVIIEVSARKIATLKEEGESKEEEMMAAEHFAGGVTGKVTTCGMGKDPVPMTPARGALAATKKKVLPPLTSFRRHPSSSGSADMFGASNHLGSPTKYKSAPPQGEGLKEVEREEYRDHLVEAAAAAASTGPGTAPAATGLRSILWDTILLADDSSVQLQLATRQINRKFSRHTLWTAAHPDGVKTLCQDQLPHLMILDNSMPEHDAGLNLARWIRSLPGGDKVTIFLWTADEPHHFDETELARLSITYVPKPELRGALEGHLVRTVPAA